MPSHAVQGAVAGAVIGGTAGAVAGGVAGAAGGAVLVGGTTLGWGTVVGAVGGGVAGAAVGGTLGAGAGATIGGGIGALQDNQEYLEQQQQANREIQAKDEDARAQLEAMRKEELAAAERARLASKAEANSTFLFAAHLNKSQESLTQAFDVLREFQKTIHKSAENDHAHDLGIRETNPNSGQEWDSFAQNITQWSAEDEETDQSTANLVNGRQDTSTS